MNKRFQTALTAGLAAVATLAVFDCSGPDGPAGLAGPAGAAGTQGPPGIQGASGMTGPQGASVGVDGGLPTSCLSPCHGFNGIVEQWKTSTHYAAFITNIGTDEADTWTGPGPCGNCHATDAIERRVAGQVATNGGNVTNLANGELNYKTGTGSVTESTYTGTSKVASVACVTCHSVTNDTDPHKTGLPWTPGSFPLRAPTGASDQAYIEKSPSTATITGTPAGNLATANACVFCHKSRKDITSYITASNKLTSPNWGPHEGPQTDVYTGLGGYHFAGQAYGTSTHQQKLTCIDCHMPDTASNNGAPNHSFYAQLDACKSCHAGATSFDIDGGQGTINAALKELQAALNTAGWLTRGTSAPYGPLGPTMLGDGKYELDKTRPDGTPTLTADQAGALYNYILIARGGALGVHNPKYTKQLIYDSYVAVVGSPPTTIVRP
jgi:hypothetical protein